ncbi:MAG: chorismate synthase [Candidatus Omnitrophica bacterium]|nr:chorismate synthase [Candidatus Omnitrophota bacterium]
MRILTAGESHGAGEIVIIEGFPQGVPVTAEEVNAELKRRMSGFGRGTRMKIEHDRVEFLAGLRNLVSLGSPLAMWVKNRDQKIFPQKKDALPALTVPRPAHADLPGALKYGHTDVRNILERASARETVARVCAGSVCKQFLRRLKIVIASHTVRVGSVAAEKKPRSAEDIRFRTKRSSLNCIDAAAEKKMREEISAAERARDSLGGISEIWAEGLVPGLGSVMHYDRRLDSRIAHHLMSIPAVKGVEFGLGFEYASCRGSESHDPIQYRKSKGFRRTKNSSGGIDGGMSTGEPVVVRIAMKPIATVRKPLPSADLKSKKKKDAIVERSDTCAILACGVIAESMLAIALTETVLEQFGDVSVEEIRQRYQRYRRRVK